MVSWEGRCRCIQTRQEERSAVCEAAVDRIWHTPYQVQQWLETLEEMKGLGSNRIDVTWSCTLNPETKAVVSTFEGNEGPGIQPHRRDLVVYPKP